MNRQQLNKRLKKKCDTLWAKLTKEIHFAKHGKTCLWCKRQTDDLQSDHIINRWKHSTRWNVSNCVVLCRGCHIFRKKREPFEWSRMVLDNVGDETFEALEKAGNCLDRQDYEVVVASLEQLERDKPWLSKQTRKLMTSQGWRNPSSTVSWPLNYNNLGFLSLKSSVKPKDGTSRHFSE